MSSITNVFGREVIDSHNLTVEAEVWLASGPRQAQVPSGASTGQLRQLK